MPVEVFLSVLVEAPDAGAADEVVSAIVDRLGEPVAAGQPSEDYPKFPGSWLTSIKLGPISGEDASSAVTSILDRLGASGWTCEVAEPLHATASWDQRAPDAGVLVEPRVTWANLLASVPDPDEEPFEPEELEPDEPVVDEGIRPVSG